MRTFLHVIWLLFMAVSPVYSQDIPVGNWREHLAYNKGQLVRQVDDRIACISEKGMFFFDPEEGSIHPMSRTDGLSDVAISSLSYHPDRDMIALGYRNGNLDLFVDQEIINVDELKNSEVSFSKEILDIEFRDERILLITEFGVVVYDLNQGAIRETWRNLGPAGDHLQIYQGAVLRDSLFLGTAQGVIAGSLDPSVNLLDFRNWRRFGPAEGLQEVPNRLIEVFEDKIATVIEDSLLYLYDGGGFEQLNYTFSSEIRSLQSAKGILAITLNDRILKLTDPDSPESINNELILEANDAVISGNDIWIADQINGLIHLNGGQYESIFPNGPFSNDIRSVHALNHEIIGLPPAYGSGYEPLNNPDGFFYFSNGTWLNYNRTGGEQTMPLPVGMDLTDVTFDPVQNKYYFASFGTGLIGWDPDAGFSTYAGSSLLPPQGQDGSVLVSAVDLGLPGEIWMINFNSDIPVHRLQDDQIWTGFPVSEGRFGLDMLSIGNGDIWISLSPLYGGGILVYNSVSGAIRRLDETDGNGGLPSDEILDITLDRDGQVWVGTQKGVAYYPFPEDVFRESRIDAVLPVYNQNFLFRNEPVFALAVDGGNRKWIGTSEGAWLFNESGIFLIRNFNTGNSPLMSDLILDIAIDDRSGEVFFATEEGLSSFRADATEPEPGHEAVKIFPNPVMPGFSGLVAINGLPDRAIIKITDISGKLVFQTRSNGGTATWNVRNYRGERPATGIYLVYSATENGEDTFVGKISVIQ